MCCAAESSGLLIKDMLIWEKNKAHGKAQDVNKIPAIKNSGLDFVDYRVGNLKPMFEPFLYATKPYKGTISGCVIKDKLGGFFSDPKTIKSNVFKYNSETGLHPTQKPLGLLEDLIKTFSFEGQVILDPYMGSGTTCLAAKNLNRQFIGIEKEEEYYNIALKRLDFQNH
jgi:site-specific DNA-methyltransferase (adenine-specific)